MANHKSAAKKARRDAEARLRNRSNRSTMKSAIKKFLSAVLSGNKETATQVLPGTLGVVDRSVRKGVLHKNAADRYKSRLTMRLNKMA